MRRLAAAGALLRREASACEAALQRDMVAAERAAESAAARSRTAPSFCCSPSRGCGGRHRSRPGRRGGGSSHSPAPRTWMLLPAWIVLGMAPVVRGSEQSASCSERRTRLYGAQSTLRSARSCRHRPAQRQVNGHWRSVLTTRTDPE